jgi:hypothetical protein
MLTPVVFCFEVSFRMNEKFDYIKMAICSAPV